MAGVSKKKDIFVANLREVERITNNKNNKSFIIKPKTK